MKITKKLRNQILDIVADISREKLREHCPEATQAHNHPDDWPDSAREKYSLVSDVTGEIERRLSAKLSAMVL